MKGLKRLAPSRWLGRTADVVIDRPLGTTHPGDNEIIYPVNYGFVPGTLAGDGHPIDAYVLGTNEPLDTTSGDVVAVVSRADDVEDKLVVALPGSGPWAATEIAVAVEFQERWFDSTVRTATEPALPVAALRRAVKALVVDRAGRLVLVRYERSSTAECWWSLPGGAIDPGETPDAALRRELNEELGLVDTVVGSARWLQPCTYPHDGRTVHQAEWIHVVNVEAAQVDLGAPGAAAEGISETRWWSAGELKASHDTVCPAALGTMLREALSDPVGPEGPPRLVRA